MGNKDLIIDLKEVTFQQTKASARKIIENNNDLFEQGFIRGYISSINYVNAILKQNNIISVEDFINLNEFIAESLELAKEFE